MNGDKNQACLANSGRHFVITSTPAGTFGGTAIFLVRRDRGADRLVDRGCYGWAYCVPEFRRDKVKVLPPVHVGLSRLQDEASIAAVLMLPAPQMRDRNGNTFPTEAKKAT